MWWKPVATITLINQNIFKNPKFFKIPGVSNNNNSCPVFFFRSGEIRKKNFSSSRANVVHLVFRSRGCFKKEKKKTRKRGEKGKQKTNARDQKRDTIKLHLINICLYIYIPTNNMWTATLRPTARKKKKRFLTFSFAVELISSYKTVAVLYAHTPGLRHINNFNNLQQQR